MYWNDNCDIRGCGISEVSEEKFKPLDYTKVCSSRVVELRIGNGELEEFRSIFDLFRSLNVYLHSDPYYNSFYDHIRRAYWVHTDEKEYKLLLQMDNEMFGFFKVNNIENVNPELYFNTDPFELIDLHFTDQDYESYIEETRSIDYPIYKCKSFDLYCNPKWRNLFIDVTTGEEIFPQMLSKKISVQPPIPFLKGEQSNSPKNFTQLVDWGMDGLWYGNGLTYMLQLGSNFNRYLMNSRQRYIYEFVPINERTVIEDEDVDEYDMEAIYREYDGSYDGDIGVFWRLQKGFKVQMLYKNIAFECHDPEHDLWTFYLEPITLNTLVHEEVLRGKVKTIEVSTTLIY